MSIELIMLIMFGGLIVLLILGLPLTFCLGGMAVVVTYFIYGIPGLSIIAYQVFGYSTTQLFMAAPLFIFMGILLERSGVAEALYECVYRWSGSTRGGLAMGTVVICAIFAAMTGVTAAATVTMGLIAVPAMLSRRYNKSLALGTVAGAGTLGILIPPSIPMIVLAMVGETSVGKLFMGGIFPGFLLGFLFIAYIAIRGLIQPQSCPAHGGKFTLGEKIISTKAVILPLCIIFAVIGSIFFGVATPTEAGAIGAVGCLIAVAIHRRFNLPLLKEASYGTFRITCMVLWIGFGAITFGTLLTGSGSIRFMMELATGLEMSPWVILIGIMGLIFILGMFIDPFAIIFIVAPASFPLIKALGFDPVWFGILFVIGLQMGYITPPFGFNLFYLKATAPEGITMADIYRSIWPFLGLMVFGLVLIMLFPEISLWLPRMMIKAGG